jgi:hypothetical protein
MKKKGVDLHAPGHGRCLPPGARRPRRCPCQVLLVRQPWPRICSLAGRPGCSWLAWDIPWGAIAAHLHSSVRAPGQRSTGSRPTTEESVLGRARASRDRRWVPRFALYHRPSPWSSALLRTRTDPAAILLCVICRSCVLAQKGISLFVGQLSATQKRQYKK